MLLPDGQIRSDHSSDQIMSDEKWASRRQPKHPGTLTFSYIDACIDACMLGRIKPI